VAQSSGDSTLDELPEKYFLFVGQRSGHKNAELVLQAFSRAGESEWSLVFVGGGEFSREEKLLIQNLGLNDRVSCLVLADEEMARAYRNASALIVPSKIEGFGLPLVEAALFRCPVFASRIPVFEEVMGDAAFYFDAVRPDELSTLIQSLVSGELPLDQLKSSGDKIAQRFSWYECASKTAAYYKEIVSKYEKG
jgi:glycosyltransferase involved in cell wall biosynthesis